MTSLRTAATTLPSKSSDLQTSKVPTCRLPNKHPIFKSQSKIFQRADLPATSQTCRLSSKIPILDCYAK